MVRAGFDPDEADVVMTSVWRRTRCFRSCGYQKCGTPC